MLLRPRRKRFPLAQRRCPRESLCPLALPGALLVWPGVGTVLSGSHGRSLLYLQMPEVPAQTQRLSFGRWGKGRFKAHALTFPLALRKLKKTKQKPAQRREKTCPSKESHPRWKRVSAPGPPRAGRSPVTVSPPLH